MFELVTFFFGSPFFVPVFGFFFMLVNLAFSVANLLKTLVIIETILLVLSFGFVVASMFLSVSAGYIFALFILALAGCESALGLSLLIIFFRNRGVGATFESLSSLKG